MTASPSLRPSVREPESITNALADYAPAGAISRACGYIFPAHAFGVPWNDGEVLRLSGGLEHRGVERLARAFAGPDHELECLEVAFRGVERGIEQRLALTPRNLDAAGEQQRMAEHHDAVLGPHVEVADPELLIDK